MKTRWNLFTYPLMDGKAAEAMLNRQAAQGWQLKKIWFRLLACFEPARTPVTYFIDWADPIGDEYEDYVDLCAQAGWTLKQQADHWNIYEAPTGTPPIQTDSQLEYQRFQDKVMRWLKLSAGAELIALVLLGIICLGQPEGMAFPLTIISSSTTLGMLLFVFPLFLIGDLLWMGRLVLRLLQWRAAAQEGSPMPTPGPVSANIAKLLCLLPPIWCVLAELFMAVDCMDGRKIPAQLAISVLGAALILLFYKRALGQRKRVRLACFLMLIVMAFAFVIQAVWGPVTAPLMITPPLSEAEVLPMSESSVEETDGLAEMIRSESVVYRSANRSFFLGHTGWKEEEFDSADLIPQMAPQTPEVYQRWDAWTARWNWLADGAQRLLTQADMAPLPGYDGVWVSEDLYLIRRDNTILRVETHMPAEQWLDHTLEQLEAEHS
ncbi:DUF2812 domain-containing protein [Flavonifractor sp. AGMB03687]|uniref:DUF2812 domain-containing protein n=1 Tax=Flavonifractor sp. AGMB03687 TaxID=2785133 RepID=UPI001ADED802|nr:DUF2812 domain-containing protein [Flavonifractor sp. AGMB03687]